MRKFWIKEYWHDLVEIVHQRTIRFPNELRGEPVLWTLNLQANTNRPFYVTCFVARCLSAALGWRQESDGAVLCLTVGKDIGVNLSCWHWQVSNAPCLDLCLRSCPRWQSMWQWHQRWRQCWPPTEAWPRIQGSLGLPSDKSGGRALVKKSSIRIWWITFFWLTVMEGDPAVFGFGRHGLYDVGASGGCEHAGVGSSEVHCNCCLLLW